MPNIRSRRFRSNFRRELAEHEGTLAVLALIITLGLFFLQDCSSAHVLHQQVKAVEENARSLKEDIGVLNRNTRVLQRSIQSLDTALGTISGAAGVHIENFRETTGQFADNIETSLEGQSDLIFQIDSLNRSVASLIREMKTQNEYLGNIDSAGSEMRAAARDIRISAKKVEVHSDRVVENTTPERVRLYFDNEHFNKPKLDSTVYTGTSLTEQRLHSFITSQIVNRQHILTDFSTRDIGKYPFVQAFNTLSSSSDNTDDSLNNNIILNVKIETRGLDMTNLVLNMRFPSFLRGHVQIHYANPNKPNDQKIFSEATSTIDDDVFFLSVPLNTENKMMLVIDNFPDTVWQASDVDKTVFVKVSDKRLLDSTFNYFVIPYYCMPDNNTVNPDNVVERDALVFVPNSKFILKSLHNYFVQEREEVSTRLTTQQPNSASQDTSVKKTELHDLVLTEFYHMIPREIK